MPMQEATIIDGTTRHSAISGQSIHVSSLSLLLEVTELTAPPEEYRRLVVDENLFGLDTESGRDWRYKLMRRLYLFDPQAVVFRALRDLAELAPRELPLLAGLCALTQDTLFRATADLILASPPGALLDTDQFAQAIEGRFPDHYLPETRKTVARRASSSWLQTGHLRNDLASGARIRQPVEAGPAAVSYALLLGGLEGRTGHALFETFWARTLDAPLSELVKSAQQASGLRMIDFRGAGGVVEVAFSQLVRPLEGQLA